MSNYTHQTGPTQVVEAADILFVEHVTQLQKGETKT
jgi:hypothetical protein